MVGGEPSGLIRSSINVRPVAACQGVAGVPTTSYALLLDSSLYRIAAEQTDCMDLRGLD